MFILGAASLTQTSLILSKCKLKFSFKLQVNRKFRKLSEILKKDLLERSEWSLVWGFFAKRLGLTEVDHRRKSILKLTIT